MKSLFTLFSLALLCSFSLGAQDLQAGLVMHYPLDGNLTDTISGITADNNGNLTFADGLAGGKAVRFFTEEAYFLTPREKLQVGPEADGGTAGTFSMFVNHRDAPLMTDRQNYLAQKNGCGPEDNNRGRVVLYRQDPTGNSDPDSLISFFAGRPNRTGYKLDMADTWIHLTLTVDPEIREWAFYVNGAEFSRDTFPGTTNAENSCGEYVVGHHLTFTTGTQTFDGLMDDLRFYNRVLTDREIFLLSQQFPTATREVVVNDGARLFPNPVATGQDVQIDIDQSVFPVSAQLKVNVTDALGRVVLSREFDGHQGRIALGQNLKVGTYTVSLTDGVRLTSAALLVR
ncbi:LamG-like jellyroll fold domain-containing protein [Neolewinella persica]|uniref:LamG-like jellyroll fold domain-containing protein n=1 Tax=Neolewinella persica TaxID=70998 RepID=UPI00038122D0|nr:LamG-like jellyroll fold domain-containing protein [Neolewinella persica]